MKPKKTSVDEIIKQSLPSAELSEMDAALNRVSNRLWDHDLIQTGPRDSSLPNRAPRRVQSRILAIAGIAAAIVLAFVISSRTVQSAPAILEDNAGTRRIQFDELVSPNGAGTLKFPDGSQVEMRSDSQVLLRQSKSGVQLQVRSGGVIVNAAAPLRVQTNDISAEGKVFFVSAKQEGSRVAAIGSEAQVQQGPTERKLLPGEQLSTNSESGESFSLQDEIRWIRQLQTQTALAEIAAAEAQRAAAPASSPSPAFDVVSIRLSNGNLPQGARGSGAGYGCAGNGPTVDPGRITFNNQNLYTLVTMAYDFNCIQAMSLGLVSGGPSFVGTDQYVIQVTIPKDVDFQPVSGRRFSLGQYPIVQGMFRKMLADRFKLAVHKEKKEMSAYALTVAKGGSKLRADAPFLPKDAPTPQGAGDLRASGASMDGLANLLSYAMKKPVVDRTGISGSFPIFVYYAMPGDASLNPSPFPDLITAVEEQLGLKLESTKTMVDTIVIDHAEKPTEN
jgi:uncharacterized protein (TIGR03435 family)